MLFFVAIFDMTFTAQGHKILDLILTFTATHTSGNNMMDVNSSVPAHLAWDKVIHAIPKMI
jgi:hypothetical protein